MCSAAAQPAGGDYSAQHMFSTTSSLQKKIYVGKMIGGWVCPSHPLSDIFGLCTLGAIHEYHPRVCDMHQKKKLAFLLVRLLEHSLARHFYSHSMHL